MSFQSIDSSRLRRLTASFGATILAFLIAHPANPASNEEDRDRASEVRGRIEVVIGDDWERGRSDKLHFVRDEATGKAYRLRSNRKIPAGIENGARIRLRGEKRGSEVFLATNLAGNPDIEVLEAAETQAAVSGNQSTIVIVAGFASKPVSCSIADISDRMFTGPAGTTVDDLYQETSYGAVSFSGDVRGPYVLSSSPSTCNTSGWANEMDDLASADGVNLNAYSRKIYVLPNGTACGYAGLGQVGGSNTRAWVLRCELADVYAHELGHNLGMGHAADPGSDYGDTSDIMGISGLSLRQLNGPHKVQMGWADGAQVVDVNSSGVYDLSPLELSASDATHPQVYRLDKPDTGHFYYLSYREAIGFDANLAWGYRDQLHVHRYSGSGSAKTMLLATLEDGQSYVDDVNGITFTQIAHVPGQLTLEIQQGDVGCNVSSPTMDVSPASQTGLGGDTLSYQVQLTNRDGSGCDSSTFSLTGSAPSGWSASLSPASLTLGPGQSGSATMSVTSEAGASPGTYTVTADASDAATTGHDASRSALYVVDDGCVTAAPDVTLSPASQSGAAGDTREYTLQVTSRDGAACGSADFSTSSSAPSGWVKDLSPSILSLAPGQSKNATLFVTANPDAAAGSYQVSGTATHSADGSQTATATGSFDVEATCTPSTPLVTVTPARQSGQAGDRRDFSVTVVNMDSAACAGRAFSLTSDQPGGWSGSMTPASATIMPGASASATLSVTSSGAAATGFYNVSARATATSGEGETASGNAVYEVSDPDSPPDQDSEPPTVPTGVSASGKRRQITFSWNASMDNVGVAGYRVYRDGSQLATTTDTSYFDGDGTTGAVYSVTAFDAAGNESGQSEAVSAGNGKPGGDGGGGGGGGKRKSKN